MIANATLALLYPTLLTSMMHTNYTIFPNEEGVPHVIKIDHTPLSLIQLNFLHTNLDTVNFTLFTRTNGPNGQQLFINDTSSVKNSNWRPSSQTILVTHGWTSAGNTPSCTLVRDAYLKVMDCNVIVVDWSAIADDVIYTIAAKSVPSVAERVASFVNFMRAKAGLKTSTMKFIGHSLGAHVASLSARIVNNSSQVAEVIALDPAKPMFQGKGPDGRVDRTHAKNVQVIHTCAGLLGMTTSVGTSDFFANGGRHQPGCSTDMLGSCAHGRSYRYYSESITNPTGFLSTPEGCGPKAYMGGPVPDPRASGTYEFNTRSEPPYALGG